MKKIVLQLFVNKAKLVREIEHLQNEKRKEWNEKLVDAKHEDLDRTNHLIELFFDQVNWSN